MKKTLTERRNAWLQGQLVSKISPDIHGDRSGKATSAWQKILHSFSLVCIVLTVMTNDFSN